MFRKCVKRPLWPSRPFLRRNYGLYSTYFSRHKNNTLVANIWHSPLLEITSIKGARTHSLFTAIQISFLMRFLWDFFDKPLLRCWLLDLTIYAVYFKSCGDQRLESKCISSKECSLSSFTLAKMFILSPGWKKKEKKDRKKK